MLIAPRGREKVERDVSRGEHRDRKEYGSGSGSGRWQWRRDEGVFRELGNYREFSSCVVRYNRINEKVKSPFDITVIIDLPLLSLRQNDHWFPTELFARNKDENN